MKGKCCVSKKRTTVCKSSASSSISRRLRYSCGDEVTLLRSNSTKKLVDFFGGDVTGIRSLPATISVGLMMKIVSKVEGWMSSHLFKKKVKI
ncbi:serine/threonine protein kinase [Sesbania bispinosa]|nr:serine/threonine protein kinase [Sesbania bispinosa]